MKKSWIDLLSGSGMVTKKDQNIISIETRDRLMFPFRFSSNSNCTWKQANGDCYCTVIKSPSVCVSFSGVLRLRSVRRLQPGLLYDSGPKQPAQLVEVHTLPSSSSFSSSSSLSSTLANTGSQNPPSMSCQSSDNQKRTKTTTNQPAGAVDSNDFTFPLELRPCCIGAPGPPATQRHLVK